MNETIFSWRTKLSNIVGTNEIGLELMLGCRDAENAELKTEVARLRHDIEEMKQQTQVITEDTSPVEVIPKISTASIPSNQCDKVNSSPSSVSGWKSLKDREMDAFLESEYKRKVSDEIKQRNKEKKLLRESPTKSHSEDVKTVTKCHDRSTLRKSEKIGKTTNGGQTNAFIPLKAEILDQYPNLYKEFSSKNFDYYGVTEETSCPLCKLKHDNEESIED
ncbi:hypothetical protein GLOIN_2v1790230 [Rhizophagus clarus]|uniref:Uncharacterized protein n=1 Tax=Rhizophagus clarus TaxID=94130 RepID=A0A8H3MF62_9GLOM|nr:hypothetical protein GLOIN_2v1790230 [Rhizophagus clarus]